jgi:hypothetical protein
LTHFSSRHASAAPHTERHARACNTHNRRFVRQRAEEVTPGAGLCAISSGCIEGLNFYGVTLALRLNFFPVKPTIKLYQFGL